MIYNYKVFIETNEMPAVEYREKNSDHGNQTRTLTFYTERFLEACDGLKNVIEIEKMRGYVVKASIENIKFPEKINQSINIK